MTILNHNSAEFIKSQIYRSVDGTSAQIHSQDIISKEDDLSDRDDSWNEACDYADSVMIKDGFQKGVTEDNGDYSTHRWEK